QPETPPAQPTVKPLFENLTARLRHRHSASNDAASSVQGSLPRDFGSLSPGTAWSATGGTNGAELWLIHGGQTGPSRVGIGPGDSYKYAGLDPGHHVGGEVLAILSVKLGTTNIATFGTKGSLDPNVPSQLLPLNATAAEVLKPLSLPSYPGPLAMTDIDGDGDLDLFVGGRCVPGRWPAPASSTILRLEGGRYAADTEADPVLKNIGLVSGAVFSDLDDDGDPDLALACEWGPVRVLINEKGRLVDATKAWGLGNEIGLWNGIIAGDFNNDGRMDLMASNEGLNNGVAIRNGRAGRIMMAYGDLRGDGTFGFLEGVEDSARGTWVALRPFNQVALTWPSLRDRFPSYSAYNHASFDEILGDARQRATLIRADTFASTIFLNRSNKFEATMLPMEAQRAPCFGIGLGDFDGDGNEDVFLAQNLSAVDSITPPANSGDGVLLRGRGDGSFQALPPKESGIRQRGDGRGVAAADFNRDGRLDLVVAQHNHSTLLFRNDTGKPGIHVQLNGSSVNPDAIGASVRLIYANRKGPRREVRAGGGYLSQDEPRILMGAAEPVVGVEVRWPQGKAIRIPVQPNSQSAEATYGKPLGTGE
ncbi:MAG: CRTAC1 family protein, partial [Verrucomicrobia bacterium]|nr:CRTAC1 family protein [Verrucomicrobiota bacterium]